MNGSEVAVQALKQCIVYLWSNWCLQIVQNIINFNKDGSWNSFWFISQIGIWNSFDCRAICVLLFFFCYYFSHSSPPYTHLFSLPSFPAPVAILFCSWSMDKAAWTCILCKLGRLFPKFVTVFFTCHAIWRVVMKNMSNK